MENISTKPICLKLNKSWQAVQITTVQQTIVDLVAGVVMALDINYPIVDGVVNTTQYDYVRPVNWEEWITLPIRSWDPVIHTSKLTIRIPTVVIANKYNKMPMKKFRGKPTKEALFYRDGGRDIYTGNILSYEDSSVDHIIPRSKNGTDTFENTGLTLKSTNNKKGNLMNSEAGLKLQFNPTVPKDVPICKTFTKIRHVDWKFFLESAK